MAKKVGKVRKAILNLKLRVPHGVRLSTGETAMLIDTWKEDHNVLDQNHTALLEADKSIARNLENIPEIVAEVTQSRTEAARFFKITKDPVKKREWARRLVVAERSRAAIIGSKKRMSVMSDRIKTLVADAALEKKALEVRIAEAEAYQKMGAGLRLVGASLIDARFRAQTAEVQFNNLELGIENLEKTVKLMPEDSVVAEAQRILSSGKSGAK